MNQYDPMKQIQADQLLDAIGDIQDSYLVEAASYRRPDARKHASRRSLRSALIAASLIVVVCIGMVNALRNPGHGNTTPDSPHDQSLSQLLYDCTQSDTFTACTAEDLDFFDRTVRVTVEDGTTGQLYISRPLTAEEQAQLKREMRASARRVSADTPAQALRVWVTMGDGSVITPCLAASEGNVGAATLFDYGTERVPTQIFMDLLSALL